MKIAVTYEAGIVFQHFGHTAAFKIYEVENGEVKASHIVDTNGHGHGALAGFLQNLGVNILICGGIGGGAQTALNNAGIKFYGGVRGDADDVVLDYLNGTLQYNPCVQCNHHGHDHNCGGNCGQ